MNNRKMLFDPIFSPKFYEYNEVNSEFKVDFPLPPSVETIKEFLQSRDGEKFRKGLIALVDRLEQWLRNNNMSELEGPCEEFKRIYSGFSGNDPEFNKIYFALFRQGIPHLAAICDLLDSDKIALDFKKDNVRNLIAGIKVCPPGASTNIADTYWKLASQLNLATELMATRRQIFQQIILEALQGVKTKLKLPDDEMVGMEIHYVNAIINQFADLIGVNVTKDEYEKICDRAIMIALLESMITTLFGKLTVNAVLKKIAYERDVEALLNSDMSFNKIQSFEQGLMHYGDDPDFSFHDIILIDEGSGKCKHRWHIDYNIMLTLFNRFARNGYFRLDEFLRKYKVGNLGEVSYLPGNSLELASVSVAGGKQLSVIPYCVEIFAGDNAANKTELLNYLVEQCNDEQRFDIVQGVLKYMKYHAEQMQQKDVLLAWIKVLMSLSPTFYKFDLILKELPKAGQELFLHLLGGANLKKLIRNGTQLVNVLGILENDQAYDLLNNLIGKNDYPALIDNDKQLAVVLNVLPKPEWDACIVALGGKRKAIMRVGAIDSSLIALLFSRLPAAQWNAFFLRHYSEHWWNCITDMSQVTAILKEIPQDKWKLFFVHVDSDKLIKLIGYQRVLLINFFNWRRLMALLKILSAEQGKVFLQHLGSHALRTIIGGKYMSPLPDILEELPEDKCRILLDCFNKNKLIEDVMMPRITLFDLVKIMASISENKCGFLLDYLGQETVDNMMEEAPHLWYDLLKSLPPKKCALFFDRLGHERLERVFYNIKRILYTINDLSIDKAELFLSRFSENKKQFLREGFVLSVVNQIFNCKFDFLQDGREEKLLAEMQRLDAEIYSTVIPDGLSMEKENLLLQHLRLHRDHISGWILLRVLLEKPQIFNQRQLKNFDVDKLLALFADNAGLVLNIIPEDKCALLFAKIKANLKPRLVENLQQHLRLKKSLVSYTKMPKPLGLEIMSVFSMEELAVLVKTKEDLIAALKFIPANECVNLLDILGAKRLCELLLVNISYKQQIASFNQYKSDQQLYDSLLLALLRARKEQYVEESQQPHLISLFRPAPINAAAQDLLEQSLIKSISEGNSIGLVFFNHETRGNEHKDIREAVNEGYLKNITQAFKANL